jgi:hypothetical protein
VPDIPGRLRMALDVNFPEPILACLDEFLVDVELIPLRKIDHRLPELDDRPLMLALRQEGYDWLVTNNYRMLRNPKELAAIIAAQVNVFAVQGTGHDPIRATGAVLLDLAGAIKRAKLVKRKGVVFWSHPRNPEARDPDDLFTDAARRAHRRRADLYDEVAVTAEEMQTPWVDLID